MYINIKLTILIIQHKLNSCIPMCLVSIDIKKFIMVFKYHRY